MSKITIVLLVPFLILLNSCTKEDAHKNETTQKKEVTEKKDEHSQQTKLTLNNGNKWKSDVPTDNRVKEMLQIVNKYDAAKEKNYKNIGNELQSSIDKLLQECKMKGSDHDALHSWLEPVIFAVNDLKKNDKDAEHKFHELKLQLQEYNNYFEL